MHDPICGKNHHRLGTLNGPKFGFGTLKNCAFDQKEPYTYAIRNYNQIFPIYLYEMSDTKSDVETGAQAGPIDSELLDKEGSEARSGKAEPMQTVEDGLPVDDDIGDELRRGLEEVSHSLKSKSNYNMRVLGAMTG